MAGRVFALSYDDEVDKGLHELLMGIARSRRSATVRELILLGWVVKQQGGTLAGLPKESALAQTQSAPVQQQVIPPWQQSQSSRKEPMIDGFM